jgi:AAA15 family ATPase/GTPase
MLNIKSLLLDNFRIYSQTANIKLAPLTILTGPNSSGKSTIPRSLLLMKNLNTKVLPFRLRLDSGKDPFGSFDMIANNRSDSNRISLGYDLHNIILGENLRIVFTFKKDSEFEAVIRNISIESQSGTVFDFRLVKDKIMTALNASYLIEKMKEIKKSRNLYLELERNFRDIRSASGSFNENRNSDSENPGSIKIFQIDKNLKRKNISEYLKSKNLTTEEFERLYYLFGQPKENSPEVRNIERIQKILSDYNEDDILFNNELINKLIDIPEDQLDEHVLKAMIKKEFPDLHDCLALMNSTESLTKIARLLKSRSYAEWEKEFLESETVSSRRLADHDAEKEFSRSVEHHFQLGFEKSEFLRAVTELSMTREGFLQVYNKYSNIRALASFSEFLIGKILQDLQLDIEKTSAIDFGNPGMTAGFDNPLHELILHYSCKRGDDTFLKTWLEKFNICDELTFETPVPGLGFFPVIRKNKETNSLASEGNGTNNLIMLILGIADSAESSGRRDFNDELTDYPKTLFIENPESGLHPGWQSRLADMINDARKTLGLHFLIETHSEYFIRKIQYLIATRQLEKDEVMIYNIGRPSRNCKPASPRIIEIVADEEGNLSHDPVECCFEDEDSQAVNLYRLKKTGRN